MVRNEVVSRLSYSISAGRLHLSGFTWHTTLSTGFAQPAASTATTIAVKYAAMRLLISDDY